MTDAAHIPDASCMNEFSSSGAAPAPGGLEVVSIAKSYDKRAVLTDISRSVAMA